MPKHKRAMIGRPPHWGKHNLRRSHEMMHHSGSKILSRCAGQGGWFPHLCGNFKGTGIEVVGFDPFTAPINTTFPDVSGDGDLSTFLSPPGFIFVHPDTVDLLPENLPPLRISETVPPGQIITDVSVAMSLLNRDTLSSILVLDVQPGGVCPVRCER